MSEDPNSNQEESNRRDFLSGKSALEAARAKLASQTESDEAPLGSRESGLVGRQSSYVEQYSKNAMACEFELIFNMHQYPQSGVAVMSAFQLIDDLEDQMTIYRSHSELSHLNAAAAQGWVALESGLYELLKQSQQINSDTNQAFDITAGPLSQVWGFDKRSGNLPEQSAIASALEKVGMDNVEFDDEKCSIRFRSQGVSVNLNGIGKGHALDRVAQQFESESIGDFIIHGGQSSVLARGGPVGGEGSTGPAGQQAGEKIGWDIGVSHPTLPGVRLGEFNLRNRALGTSGTARQGFFHKGKRYGHIIDPRTGWPTHHLLSTTVVSDSAALSDALATAFFVMPISEVQNYCDSHKSVSAILVESNPKTKSKVNLHCFNVADGDWRVVV